MLKLLLNYKLLCLLYVNSHRQTPSQAAITKYDTIYTFGTNCLLPESNYDAGNV